METLEWLRSLDMPLTKEEWRGLLKIFKDISPGITDGIYAKDGLEEKK